MSDKVISIQLTMDDREFTVSTKRLGSLLTALQRDLQSTATAANRVEARMGGLGTAFRHVVMTAAAVRFALMDINDVFLSLPRSILKTTGEFERLTTLLNGLSTATTAAGKIKESGESFAYIIDVAKSAPFEIKAITDSFVKFKSAGLDPTNGSMQALIDAVARFGGDSDTLKRASIAIQQMAGKGVISMEELRQQLGEAVPTAMRSMAEGMGMTMSELTAAVSKGTVESTSALRKMFTMMNFESRGAAKDFMGTWTGITSKLKTEWDLLLNDTGKSEFAAEVKRQLQDLTDYLGSNDARKFAQELGRDLASVVRGMRSLVDMTVEYGGVVKTLVSTMAAFWAVNKVNAYRAAVAKTFQESQKAFLQSVQENRDKASAEAAIANVQAQNAVRLNAARVVNEKDTYRQLRAARDEYHRHIAQLEADTQRRLQTSRNPKYDRNIMANDVQVEAIRAQLVANDLLIAKQREVGSALLKERGELQKTAAQKLKVADAAMKASQNIGLMTRAMGAGQFVFNALGGWLGMVTLALTVGATMWDAWANKGERALKRVRDAINSGTSDKSTVADIDSQIEAKRAELKSITDAQAARPNLPTGVKKAAGLRGGAADEVALAQERARIQTEQELQELQKQRILVENDAIRNESQARAATLSARVDAELKAVKDTSNAALVAAKTEGDAKLATLKKGSKEYDAQVKANANLARQAALDQAKQEQTLLEKQATEAKRQLESLTKSGADRYEIGTQAAFVATLNEKLLANQTMRENAEYNFADNVILGDKKGKKGPKDPRDRITKAIDKASSSLDKAMVRLDDLNEGVVTYQRLYDSVLAGLEADRENGNLQASDSELGALAGLKAQKEEVDRLAKSLISLNREEEKIKTTRAELLARYDDPLGAENSKTGVFELEQALQTLGKTLTETGRASDEFRTKSASLISKQAVNDYLDFVSQLKEKSKDLTIDLMPYESDRLRATQQRELADLDRQYRVRRDKLTKEVADKENANALIARSDADYFAYRQQIAQRQYNEARPLLEQTLVEWTNVYSQMNHITDNWAQQGMDAWVNFTTTGKFEWRNMLANMLTDASRFMSQIGFGQLFKGLATPDAAGTGGFTQWLSSAVSKVQQMLGMTAGTGGTTTPAADAASAAGTIGTNVLGAMSGTGAEGAAAKAIAGAGNSASALTSSLNTLGKDTIGVSSGFIANTVATSGLTDAVGASTVSTVTGMLTDQAADAATLSASSSATMEMILMSIALQGASASLYALAAAASTAAATSTATAAFADGGIMTGAGSVPLKKYARGGIATRPQLALFGEGSMAEAYVPLPDGRSIPVTMQGDMKGATGGANIVNISINVNENGQASTSKSGMDTDRWSSMANQIVSLVDDRINNATRNGGILSKNR